MKQKILFFIAIFPVYSMNDPIDDPIEKKNLDPIEEEKEDPIEEEKEPLQNSPDLSSLSSPRRALQCIEDLNTQKIIDGIVDLRKSVNALSQTIKSRDDIDSEYTNNLLEFHGSALQFSPYVENLVLDLVLNLGENEILFSALSQHNWPKVIKVDFYTLPNNRYKGEALLFTTSEMHALKRFWDQSPNLVGISLIGLQMSKVAMLQILKTLNHCNQLEDIFFSDSHFGEVLNADNCFIKTEEVIDSPTLEKKAAYAAGTLYCPKLREICFSNNNIGECGISFFVHSFKTGNCNNVKRFDFSYSGIGDTEIIMLAEVFKTLPKLSILNLSGNSAIGYTGLWFLTKALKDQHLSALQVLTLSHLFQKNSMTHCTHASKSAWETQLKELLGALHCCPHLTDLDLSYTPVGDGGACALSQLLTKHPFMPAIEMNGPQHLHLKIKRLDIAHADINNSGGMVLLKAIGGSSYIRKVDLSGNLISATSVNAFCQALPMAQPPILSPRKRDFFKLCCVKDRTASQGVVQSHSPKKGSFIDSPVSVLEEMNLSDNPIPLHAAITLLNTLNGMLPFKRLSLGSPLLNEEEKQVLRTIAKRPTFEVKF